MERALTQSATTWICVAPLHWWCGAALRIASFHMASEIADCIFPDQHEARMSVKETVQKYFFALREFLKPVKLFLLCLSQLIDTLNVR